MYSDLYSIYRSVQHYCVHGAGSKRIISCEKLCPKGKRQIVCVHGNKYLCGHKLCLHKNTFL